MADKNPLESSDIQKSQDELRKAAGVSTVITNNNTGSIKKNTAAFEENTAALRGNTSASEDEARAKKKTSNEMSNLQGSIRGLGSEALKLSDSLLKGTVNLNSTIGIVEGLGKTLGSAASFIPGVGKGLEMAISGITAVAKPLIEESTRQLETFQKLSTVGANTAEGIDGLQKSAFDTLLTLDNLAKVVGQNAQSFVAYGDTVSDGVKSFEAAQTELANFDNGLRNLGMTVDDMAEGTATYMTLQAKLMKSEKLTQEQLTQGTSDYLRELDALSRATGASRKEIEDHQKAVMSEERYRANLYLMQRQGQGEQVKQVQAFESYYAKAAPEIAKGIRDSLSGSLADSPEARKLATATGGKSLELTQQVKRGEITAEEAEEQLRPYLQQAVDRFAQTVGAVNNEVVTNFAQMADASQLGDVAKAQEQSTEASENATKQTQGLVGAEKNLQQSSAELHKLLSKGVPTMTVAVNEATKAFKALTSVINDITGGTGDMLGISATDTGVSAQGFMDKVTGGIGKAWNWATGGRGRGGAAGAETGDGRVPSTQGLGTQGGRRTSQTFKQTAPKLMSDLMKDYGLSAPQAAGIVGNLAHESAGLQAGIQERGMSSGRGGLGWAQWTGPRRVQFEKYLQETGQSASDPAANYGFLKKELGSREYGNVIAKVKQAKTTEEATRIWHDAYERSGDIQHGQIVKPQVYANREKYANEALKLAGSGGSDNNTQNAQQTPPTSGPQTVQQPRPQEPSQVVNVEKEGLGHVVPYKSKDQPAPEAPNNGPQTVQQPRPEDTVSMNVEGVDDPNKATAIAKGLDTVTNDLSQFTNQPNIAQPAAIDPNMVYRSQQTMNASPNQPFTRQQTVSSFTPRLTSLGTTGFGSQSSTIPTGFYPSSTGIGGAVGGMAGNAMGGQNMGNLGTILGGVLGRSMGGNAPQGGIPGLGSIGGILGGMTGRSIPPIYAPTGTGIGGALGGVLGNAVGGQNMGNLGTIFGGVLGRSMSGNAPQGGIPGLGSIGGILGGMTGRSIPPIYGMGGSFGGMGAMGGLLGAGLNSMTSGLTTPSLTAPRGGFSGMESVNPSSQIPQAEPTGQAAPDQNGGSSSDMSTIMSAQLDKLSELGTLMRKGNATTEKILKATK